MRDGLFLPRLHKAIVADNRHVAAAESTHLSLLSVRLVIGRAGAVASRLRLRAGVWSRPRTALHARHVQVRLCTVRVSFVMPSTEHQQLCGEGAIRDTEVRPGAVRRSFTMPHRSRRSSPVRRDSDDCGPFVQPASIAPRTPIVLLPCRDGDTVQLCHLPYTPKRFGEFNDTLKCTFVKPSV